ncbi:hypothetical protein [Streptomyces paludis]|uniref:Uncharacterized protein n=1 Tax=Streptomyces paludis TaxID=2282738 RepID=A0A345HS74_9ACTN|nr:hypothetical protein [Streptomyces paludis]AXG79548.1 hypothetical protein DVK44_19965 [Streptomyces paludis]
MTLAKRILITTALVAATTAGAASPALAGDMHATSGDVHATSIGDTLIPATPRGDWHLTLNH